MLEKKAYLERTVAEVEEMAARVALLKSRIAKHELEASVRLSSELDYLRNRFAEYKRCVEELEACDDAHIDAAEQAVELVWKDLKSTIDMLMDAMP